MKTHFMSFGQSACGSFNPKYTTSSHLFVTCRSCLRVIESAAKTGQMVNLSK